MKKRSSLALLLAGGMALGQGGHAAETKLPMKPLRIIRENAADALKNAKAYQWKRVALEVQRIAAAERDLHGVLHDEDAWAAETSRLHEAVKALRAASAAHDADRTQEAIPPVLDAAAAFTERRAAP